MNAVLGDQLGGGVGNFSRELLRPRGLGISNLAAI
jgi:hypothetical protein